MISTAEFEKMHFETHGVIENKNDAAFRLPQGFRMHKDNARLCNAMSNLLHDHKDAYNRQKGIAKITLGDLLDRHCAISYETFRKYTGGKGEMSRGFLAKFCVGLNLSIEQANALFEMHSGKLNLTNDFDCIVYYALETGDKIEDFISEVKEKIGIDLW